MRGSYTMREWEVEYLTKAVKEAADFCEKNPYSTYEFGKLDICPYNIHEILTTKLGYEMCEVFESCMDISRQYIHPSWGNKEHRLYVCINADIFDLFMIKE